MALDKKQLDILFELDKIIEDEKNGIETDFEVHTSDIADALEDLKKIDQEKFIYYIHNIPSYLNGEIILELPEIYQEEIVRIVDNQQLADIVDELDTDDATDFVQIIEEQDKDKAYDVLQKIEEDHKDDIEVLKRYDDWTAGALMQVELFSAKKSETIKSSIERLKILKESEEVENISFVFITDEDNKLEGLIALEDLILQDFDKKYEDLKDIMDEPIFVYGDEDGEEVAKIVEKYNISVLPVVDNFKRLLGRITSDDIYDLIEENATDQIYSLANLHTEEELHDSVKETGKMRAIWLGINLLTAIAASFVIGIFEATIEKVVALAVLMPIVASMGGIAGTQTLTVVVRQMALGEIDSKNSKSTLQKEFFIALFNGGIFALVVSLIAYLWFGLASLGLVIACAMFVNLLFAGIFGAGIPLFLKKVGIDPAVASGVILTTVTDIVGFFTFLGLASIFLV